MRDPELHVCEGRIVYQIPSLFLSLSLSLSLSFSAVQQHIVTISGSFGFTNGQFPLSAWNDDEQNAIRIIYAHD